MGPLTFISGNELISETTYRQPGVASMGPLTFISGNPGRWRCFCRTSSFNGATDFHQWKPGLFLPADPDSGPRFNGATDFHQWKLKYRQSKLQRTLMSFNGATDFHQWKRRRPPRVRFPPRCFNGATDFHQWKLVLRCRPIL